MATLATRSATYSLSITRSLYICKQKLAPIKESKMKISKQNNYLELGGFPTFFLNNIISDFKNFISKTEFDILLKLEARYWNSIFSLLLSPLPAGEN